MPNAARPRPSEEQYPDRKELEQETLNAENKGGTGEGPRTDSNQLVRQHSTKRIMERGARIGGGQEIVLEGGK